MEQITLTIGSVTYARRAKDVLARMGIVALVTRARDSNCSYALRFDRARLADAKRGLGDAGIRFVEP